MSKLRNHIDRFGKHIFCALLMTGMAGTSAYGQAFKKFDIGVTAGTLGVGLELSSPVTDFMRVRVGGTYMPHFNYNMNFDVQVGDSPEESQSKFTKLQGIMESVTGMHVDDNVKMVGTPSFNNVKLLVDFYPLRNNKHWSLTAGFYYGTSTIAKAVNATSEMSTLMAVSMYNTIYDRILNDDPVISVGDNDVYLSSTISDKVLNYGRMGIHVGDKLDGTPYVMEPDENSMVSARFIVNKFKPYVGAGYECALTKDKRLNFGTECGMLIWGGTPSIVTHDGTDLAKDVENIPGKVGSYVRFFKSFSVYPVLNFRISYTL
jgi:hypothetical protein